jgi:hypothetical protein
MLLISLCLRNLFGNLFQQFFAMRQFLPLEFHTAMICKFRVCLGSGVCILFYEGTWVYSICPDGMEPKNLHMRWDLRQSDA